MELYYSITDCLKDPLAYEKAFKILSPYKQDRCQKIKAKNAGLSSMGADILLQFALSKAGYKGDYEYIFGANNKPYLKSSNLFFNISHSKNYCLVAVGDSEMGCDIELVEPKKNNIAKRFFHPKETDSIKCEEDFFEIWVKKESYIKMTGLGLSQGLSEFNIYDLDNVDCFFYSWDIDRYKCALCTKIKYEVLKPEYIDLHSLLS